MHQAPLSMGFSRQDYWSGVPFPSPGDLLDPGIEPASLVFVGGFSTTGARIAISIKCFALTTNITKFFLFWKS